jgi:beta-lactamase class A
VGSGPEAGVRPDEPIVAASVFKIAVALEFHRQVSAGRLDPSEPVRTTAAGRTPGPTGLSLFSDDAVISLRDLATSMMVVSDNAATDIILEKVTIERVHQTLQMLGATNTYIAHDIRGLVSTMTSEAGVSTWEDVLREDPGYERLQTSTVLQPDATTRTTARDMTTLLRAIWTDAAGPADACSNVRRVMGMQPRGRIAMGIPDARVFAKSGSLLGVVRNEVGVVELLNGDLYAMAIFTQSQQTNFAGGPEIDRGIGEVARLLVHEVANPNESR